MEEEIVYLRSRIAALEKTVTELQRKIDAKEGLESLGRAKTSPPPIQFSGQNMKQFFK